MRKVLLGATAAATAVAGIAVVSISAAQAQPTLPTGGEECFVIPGKWVRYGWVWYFEPARIVCSDDPDFDPEDIPG